jgi:hypothetical protein
MVMPVQLLANGNLQIQEYSLIDFLQEVQKYVIDGYRIDFETNEGYPQQYGSVYIAQMIPSVKLADFMQNTPEELVVDKGQVETEVQTPSKPGRKPKVQA